MSSIGDKGGKERLKFLIIRLSILKTENGIIDQSRKDCLGSKGGMSTESALYNTNMALIDQHAAQDVFDSSRVNARVSTRLAPAPVNMQAPPSKPARPAWVLVNPRSQTQANTCTHTPLAYPCSDTQTPAQRIAHYGVHKHTIDTLGWGLPGFLLANSSIQE